MAKSTFVGEPTLVLSPSIFCILYNLKMILWLRYILGELHNGMIGTYAEPTITKFPSDTNITEGEGVYFRIKVSGEPQPTVTWYHDGEPVRADYAREIESDGSLTIPSTELKHSGVYKAVATNTHGSEEREVRLTVNEEGISSTDAATMNGMVSSRPIPVPEFGKYVADLHANSNQPFKDLYQVCVSVHVKNNYQVY